MTQSCSTCSFFWHEGPSSDQPYPEFTCTKGHWGGIWCQEEQDSLLLENNCPDFEIIGTKNTTFKK